MKPHIPSRWHVWCRRLTSAATSTVHPRGAALVREITGIGILMAWASGCGWRRGECRKTIPEGIKWPFYGRLSVRVSPVARQAFAGPGPPIWRSMSHGNARGAVCRTHLEREPCMPLQYQGIVSETGRQLNLRQILSQIPFT